MIPLDILDVCLELIVSSRLSFKKKNGRTCLIRPFCGAAAAIRSDWRNYALVATSLTVFESVGPMVKRVTFNYVIIALIFFLKFYILVKPAPPSPPPP